MNKIIMTFVIFLIFAATAFSNPLFGGENKLELPKLTLKDNKKDTVTPFPHSYFSLTGIYFKTLENDAGTQELFNGACFKFQQPIGKKKKTLFGGEAVYMKTSFKNTDVIIHGKIYGGGIAWSFFHLNGWTDFGIKVLRFEKDSEVMGNPDITSSEKREAIDFTLLREWRNKFKGGFALTSARVWIEYIYPVSKGSKETKNKDSVISKSDASEIKSSYARLELGLYNVKFSNDIAAVVFGSAGYDHQSYNISDNYSFGFGIRVNIKDIEAVSLSYETRNSVPKYAIIINVIPIGDLLIP
jgi:hypothetical protein